MKQSIIRIVCFVIVLGIVLLYGSHIFEFKYGDGIYDVTKFYELEDNTVDVLVLGSSHAFEDFNTGTLWDEYGMASYILAGSMQPMWNTYYYLKEALKTQTPELIVLEGFCLEHNEDFNDDSRIIKNIYGLKWSADKLNAIKISSPEERWNEFILEYTQYHTRYTEVSKADFFTNQGNPLYEDWKGFGCNMATVLYESFDVSDVETRKALHGKTEKYYRKTIELAQENHIPIVIVISPYAGINEDMQSIYNTGSDIAAEYGVDFINCNCLLDEIGIDYSTDAADPDHLNYKGNQKFTRYIGALLKEHYAISNRTGDATYASWQRNADYISQTIYDQELREMTNLDDLSQKVLNENYIILLSANGVWQTENESVQTFLFTMGLEDNELSGLWYGDSMYGYSWNMQEQGEETYIQTSAHDICMRRVKQDDEYDYNQIIIDNTTYDKVEHGINVVVYDTVTETVADCFGIDFYSDYRIVR